MNLYPFFLLITFLLFIGLVTVVFAQFYERNEGNIQHEMLDSQERAIEMYEMIKERELLEAEIRLTAEPEFVVDASIPRHDVKAMNSKRQCPAQYHPDETNRICYSDVKTWYNVPIFFIYQEQTEEYCSNPIAWGCYSSGSAGNIIYIVKGTQGLAGAIGGCSVLYHEILHAMWISHEEMARLYPNTECSVTSY